MIILKVRARGAGRIVSWLKLKRGELVDQNYLSLTLTTVLTDVVSDIYEKCKTLDDNCRLTPILSNGFTSASFDLLIGGSGYQIMCSRRLVRGGFPFNVLAAEFGKNYDVVVVVNCESQVQETEFAAELESKYQCLDY